MSSSLRLDEFGIVQEQTSKSSDSLLFTESNTNLTDDDISEHILPVETSVSHSHVDALNNDSEDITLASDIELSHSSAHHSKRSNQLDETESLTEFEEIERLIDAHTVHDSDDGLPELPIDLEQRILSGCVSRASSTRSRVNEDSSPDSRPDSPSPETSAADELHHKQPSSHTALHQDTGYVSEGANATVVSTNAASRSRSESDQEEPVSDNPSESKENSKFLNHDDQRKPSLDQNSSEEQINTSSHFSQSAASSETESNKPEEEEGGGTGESFVIPTNRHAVGDTKQPESLVATFGTTEDFEILLKQQLNSIGTDDEREAPRLDLGNAHASGDQSLQQFKLTSTYPPSSGDKLHNSTTPRPIKTKLKLSTSNRTTPRPASKPRTEKPTRSPAASKIKRVNSGARVSRLASYRDSSDDISVVSDASRTELRSKLKEEARNRRRDEEFMEELKKNYDTLLTKYAEAENTIDHLRLGAKINLYASVPDHFPREDQDGDDYSSDDVLHVNPPPVSASTRSRLPSGDTLVESSLQLPAAASKEFLKLGLQLQADDVKDKIDSFYVLLREAELNPAEREQAMEGIAEAMRDLEAEYLRAVDKHAEDQRRASIATDGAISADQEFDPERIMEADILNLRAMVRDLQHHINSYSVPESLRSPSRDQISQSDVRSNRDDAPSDSPRHDAPPDSPRLDIENQFKQLVEKYQSPISTPHDFRDESYAFDRDRSFSESQHDRSLPDALIPNQYLEPVPRNTPGADTSSEIGNSQPPNSSLLDNSTSPPSRTHPSKLPRPVASSKDGARKERSPKERSPKSRKTLPPTTGTDSGFVGSESSRQSATKLQPAKIKLVSVSPTTSPKVQKVPTSVPDTRSVASVTSSSAVGPSSRFPFRKHPRSYHHGYPAAPSHSVDDDSIDDVSTTSTVREMLRPRSSSASSSHSTAIKVPIHKGSRSGTSLRSGGSATRSVASSTRDSTLDMIRGEISKLRDEIKATKAQNPQPVFTSTPRHPPATNKHADIPPLDGDMLRSIRDDIKALKDDLEKGRRLKKSDLDAETCSATSASPSTRRRSTTETSPKTYKSRRSRSLDRRRSDRGREDSASETKGERSSRRSRSHERNGPWAKGFWAYVPPVQAEMQPPRMMTQTYPGITPSQTMLVDPYASVPLHSSPVIAPHANVVMAPPRVVATGRIYSKSTPHETRTYWTPSKPKASVFISPKQSSRGRLRKASVYVIDSDDEDVVLQRSRGRRSRSRDRKPVVVTLLNDSLERAEKSSHALRSQSRDMYRSARDTLYGAQLLADTI